MASPLRLLSAAAAGLITVTGMTQCIGTEVTVYFSDFETDDGGLVADPASDWEHGVIPTSITGASCGSSFQSPPGAFSGTRGWATNLDDCYLNQNPSAFNILDLVVDLSDPGYTSAKLEFAHWFEIFTNFDYLVITANETQIYMHNTTANSNGWQQFSANLTPFLGQQALTLSFKLWSTTVVNRAGWYIDDLRVTACAGIPQSLAEGSSEKFRIWPVPATDRLQVETDATIGLVNTWILFDATGRILAQGSTGGTSRFSVDVSSFQGMGVLELRTASGAYRRQVMIH